MIKHCRVLTLAAAGAALFLLNSCASDPYYSDHGYGGGSSYSSVFISTGNPRWGYDPHCYAYYDYNRRAYYDPYLYGYYPVGYRPSRVVGVPHPHGWRPGRSTLPPPARVTSVTLNNYRNRESSYRSLDHSWARDAGPSSSGRSDSHSPSRGSASSRPSNPPPSRYGSSSREDTYRSGSGTRTSPTQGDRWQGSDRSPSPSSGNFGYRGQSSAHSSPQSQAIPTPPPYSGSSGYQGSRGGESSESRSGPSRPSGNEGSRGGDSGHSGHSGDRGSSDQSVDERSDSDQRGGFRGR